MSKVNRDCFVVFVFFLLLRSVIGPENSFCKTKTNHDVVARLFPRFRHFGRVFFSLKSYWLLMIFFFLLIGGFFFHDTQSKSTLVLEISHIWPEDNRYELFFTLQQSISMSEWSNILACGDAAGEVVAVHVLPKKRKTFARFVRMSVKLLDV